MIRFLISKTFFKDLHWIIFAESLLGVSLCVPFTFVDVVFQGLDNQHHRWRSQCRKEHGGDLNVAFNAHFTEGDRNIQETSIGAPPEDFMDIDDPTLPSQRPPLSLFPSTRDININPFSLLDPNFTRSIFDSGSGFRGSEPFVSHPREVRRIPIEVKDGPRTESNNSGHAPRIEDVTETTIENVPETCAHVIINDDDDDEDFPTSLPSLAGVKTRLTTTVPGIGDSPDHGIEEEMIRAAIEASKQDSQMSQRDFAVPNLWKLEDLDLAQVVSLSLKTAEQEKALRQLGSEVGPLEPRGSKFELEEVDTLAASNGSKNKRALCHISKAFTSAGSRLEKIGHDSEKESIPLEPKVAEEPIDTILGSLQRKIKNSKLIKELPLHATTQS
ncbi:hypothetical protein Lser_V15G29200 [Lactuca serriola]